MFLKGEVAATGLRGYVASAVKAVCVIWQSSIWLFFKNIGLPVIWCFDLTPCAAMFIINKEAFFRAYFYNESKFSHNISILLTLKSQLLTPLPIVSLPSEYATFIVAPIH